MIKKIILAGLVIVIHQTMYAQLNTDSSQGLSSKERCIVSISAYTAVGNMPGLQAALHEGLNAGLTVSETKEMLVQLYAYAGFPRSLNALHKLMAILEERKKNGISDVEGRGPVPVAAGNTMLQTGTANQTKLVGKKIEGDVYEFAPLIDQFLKEHLFGAIFSRDILDWRIRELVTISALASMEGVEPQLRSHFGVGMYNGLAAPQLWEVAGIIETDISVQRGIVTRLVLQSVIDQKPYSASGLPDQLLFPKGQKIDNNNFTGTAWLNSLIQSGQGNNIQMGSVTFEPGARTNWHYHPGGQTLLVTSGRGLYQEKGKPVQVIQKGDVIKCPPNIIHWHGAMPTEVMVHIAVSTVTDKGSVVWLGKVSDAEYMERGGKEN